MRLNLREIIHVPGASLPFQFQLDLSGEDFFGEHPIPRPVTVTGHVKKRGGCAGPGRGSPVCAGRNL